MLVYPHKIIKNKNIINRYTFFEKAYIIKLNNVDVETENSKFEIGKNTEM